MGKVEVNDGAVLTLRQEWDDLPQDEQHLYAEALQHLGIVAPSKARVDPRDVDQHLSLCQQAGNPGQVAVILPREMPIPTKAMKLGYAHLVIVNGRVMKLVDILPDLEPIFPAAGE